MYLLCLYALMALVGSPALAHEINGESLKPVETVEIGFLTTPEHGPYPVLFVHDATLMTKLCGYEHTKARVWGCASWIKVPAPAGRCVLIVQDTPNMTRQFVREVTAHELRHCLEGAWHDEDGNEIPPKPEQPNVPDTHP